MVKLSKDNKIKNQKIQNLQTIKTKQKKYSHYCKTISVRMESFSKFVFIQFFLIESVKVYNFSTNLLLQSNLTKDWNN